MIVLNPDIFVRRACTVGWSESIVWYRLSVMWHELPCAFNLWPLRRRAEVLYVQALLCESGQAWHSSANCASSQPINLPPSSSQTISILRAKTADEKHLIRKAWSM